MAPTSHLGGGVAPPGIAADVVPIKLKGTRQTTQVGGVEREFELKANRNWKLFDHSRECELILLRKRPFVNKNVNQISAAEAKQTAS